MALFRMLRHGRNRSVLLLLIVCETLLLFYLNQVGMPPKVNALLYLGCSVSIGLAVLGLYSHSFPTKESSVRYRLYNTICIIIGGIMAVACVYLMAQIINSTKPFESSDIIPQIEEATRRFLRGRSPYAEPIYAIDHFMPLTYLPMHWLPYTFSTIFSIDPRWVSFGIWFISIIVLTVRHWKSEPLVLPLSFGLLWYIIYRNPVILSNTVELMVAGYYIFLIMALGQKNAIVKGIVIGICLLSRYSLVLWLPVLVYASFNSGRKADIWKASLSALVVIAGLYLIPFLCWDWLAFGRANDYYYHAICAEWARGDMPFHLWQGVGVASYFSDYMNGPIAHKVLVAQRVHIIVCIAVSVLLIFLYKARSSRIEYKIFLFGSFKIYLAIFLAFIPLPYIYLMIVGNFVSIAIFAELSKFRTLNQ